MWSEQQGPKYFEVFQPLADGLQFILTISSLAYFYGNKIEVCQNQCLQMIIYKTVMVYP